MVVLLVKESPPTEIKIRCGKTSPKFFPPQKCQKNFGEVAEWLKAAVSKTVKGRKVLLGFKSQPLRGSTRFARSPQVHGELSEASCLLKLSFLREARRTTLSDRTQ